MKNGRTSQNFGIVGNERVLASVMLLVGIVTHKFSLLLSCRMYSALIMDAFQRFGYFYVDAAVMVCNYIYLLARRTVKYGKKRKNPNSNEWFA